MLHSQAFAEIYEHFYVKCGNEIPISAFSQKFSVQIFWNFWKFFYFLGFRVYLFPTILAKFSEFLNPLSLFVFQFWKLKIHFRYIPGVRMNYCCIILGIYAPEIFECVL